ncbi:hypothetical protein CAPGI0001_1637 [Capnocytophaga gingivalis ATCC 33624]|uniref:hypothetical protein n=1 Tax=Capnocytophaga gingivalis TaxID=1017 RepID=UPI00019FB3F8|nr:hypothetical protein [Capnocytophaga gingivalis]EEK14612.1 hypothetical protein CAPGI0001_1637 [Capnocytophaga gingivalis ATCC 33624]
MKKIIYIVVALCIAGCNFFSKPSSSDSDELKEPPIVAGDYSQEDDGYPQVDTMPDYSPNIPDGVSDITFKREKGEAILMGDTIATYDKKGKFLEYRMDLDRKFVTIKAISELMYNDTQEYCNEYHFVKAELPNGEPLILDGRRAYKLLEKPFEKVFGASQAIRIYRTEYYGQPIFTDELTGCGSPFDPVVLVSIDGFKGLVTLEKNDIAHQVFNYDHSSRGKVDFLEFCNDEGCGEKVLNAALTSDGIVLKMHRNFQEGYTNYKILLTKEEQGYKATYLDYPEPSYEE